MIVLYNTQFHTNCPFAFPREACKYCMKAPLCHNSHIIFIIVSFVYQGRHKKPGYESTRVTQSFKYVVTPKPNTWFNLGAVDKEPLGRDGHVRRSTRQAALERDL